MAVWTNEATDQLEFASTQNILSGEWSAAQPLSTTGTNVNGYVVVISPGTSQAIAVWIEKAGNDTTIFAANLSDDPLNRQTLFTLSGTFLGLYPAVSMNSANQAVAVWSVADQTSNDWSVQAAVYDQGTWSEAQRIAADTFAHVHPMIWVDESGGATALWQMQATLNRIQSSSLNFGSSTWSPVVTLSSLDVDSFSPSLALNRFGDAYAAWIVPNGLEAAFRPSEGSWQPPILVAYDNATDTPNISLNDALTTVLVWQSTDSVISASSRHKDGEWSDATQLSPFSRVSLRPYVTLAANGQATAVWQTSDLETASSAQFHPCTSGSDLTIHPESLGGFRLAWNQSNQSNVVGYLIYRENQFLQLVSDTFYVDFDGKSGDDYTIIAVTDDGERGLPLTGIAS